MGLYRLVDDEDKELVSFETDDDAKAVREARDWTHGRVGVAAVFTLQVQRGDEGAWAELRTWVPRPQKPVWQEANTWSDGRVVKKSGIARPSSTDTS